MNDGLRIGDAERETAAHELGEHFALGRITADEHAERLEQIWAARTRADLAPVFRDLPRPQAPAAAPGTRASSTDRQDRSAWRGWRPELPHVPFPLKALLAIVLLWWGIHHALLLVIGIAVYVVFLRRLVRRNRWRRRQARWQARAHRFASGRFESGWQ